MLDVIGALSPAELEGYLTQFKYHHAVFLLPPWKEIYCEDTERDQTFDDAVAVFSGLQSWYRQQGYQIIDVPKVAVSERVSFVINEVETARNSIMKK